MISTIIFFPNKVRLTETSDGWWLTHKFIQRVGELSKDHVKYVARLFHQEKQTSTTFLTCISKHGAVAVIAIASSKIDRRNICSVVIMKQAG